VPNVKISMTFRRRWRTHDVWYVWTNAAKSAERIELAFGTRRTLSRAPFITTPSCRLALHPSTAITS